MIMGAWGLGRKPKLPYDAEVEYLETHRWSYVDTGIVAMHGCTIYFDHFVENTHFTYGQFVFGDLPSTFFYGDNWNNVAPSYAGNKGSLRSSVPVGRHAIVMDATGYYLDGTLVSGWGASTIDSANSMLLGRSRYTQYIGSRTFYGKIYSFGYDNPNGTPAQRLKPVRIGTEGAFYDEITGAILHNLGDEPFIAGPDK